MNSLRCTSQTPGLSWPGAALALRPRKRTTQMTQRVLLSVALLMFGLDVPQAYAQTAGNIYHPLAERCRVADSRAAGRGMLAASTSLDLDVTANATFVRQGGTGSSASCGIPDDAKAFAVSVTALPAGTAGFLKIFPLGGVPADGNTVSFAAGGTWTNDMIVTRGSSFGFELGVFAHASTHFIVDIVGYFREVQAGQYEQQCERLLSPHQTLAPGDGSQATGPNCAAGFTRTATSCQGGSFNRLLKYLSDKSPWLVRRGTLTAHPVHSKRTPYARR